MTPRHLVLAFRTNASPHIGGGHVTRCLALAQAASRLGSQCVFFVGKDGLRTVPRLLDSGMDITVLSDSEMASDGGIPAVLAKSPKADWIVVDDYALRAEHERLARRSGVRVMAIDDLARPHDSDIVLDQTLGRSEADYRTATPPQCRRLLGPQFALIDERFVSYREMSLARRHAAGTLARIIVSFGLSDVNGVTLKALDGIAASGVAAEIVVIAGSSDAKLAAIRDAAARMPQRCTVKTDVDDMAKEWQEADLAIGAAGVSSWERCCVGLPTLVIVTADNQWLIAQALAKVGAIRLLGEHDAIAAADIAGALRVLANDKASLSAMSAAGREICDGQGAARTAAILMAA